MQEQLSSCSAPDKMALNPPVPSVLCWSFHVAAPALLPAARTRQLGSHLWEAAELQQCIAASSAKGLLLQSRQTGECKERQTDQQTDGVSTVRAGTGT